MSRRHKEWAKKARISLTLALGGCCTACRETERLEFDCRVSMGHRHHRMDASARMCFYRKQARAGNVQLLCQFCNALKADWTPLQWCGALHFVNESERQTRLAGSVWSDHQFTPSERRECLREFVSRARARVAAVEEIKTDSSVV